MELPQLRYFQSVARLENLTKAAQNHEISQPAISRSISRLEQELGVPLLERKGRHIRLNWLGQAFLEKTNTALTLLEEAARTIEDMASAEKGSILIAESGPSSLSGLSDAFRLKHPGVGLNTIHISEDEMRACIENGEIDFALSAIPLEGAGIQSIPVFREEMLIAVSQSHRFHERGSIALGELAGEPFVGHGYGHPFHQMFESFCHQAGFRMNMVCGLDDFASIRKTVAAGLGVAFVGECEADTTASLVRLRIDGQACSRTYRLVWHKDRYLSAAARLFRDDLAAGYDARERREQAAPLNEVSPGEDSRDQRTAELGSN